MKLTFEQLCDFAEILGSLSGDGFIGNYGKRKQQFMVQWTGHVVDDEDYFNHLNKKLQKQFPLLKSHYQRKNNTLRLIYYSKYLFQFFVSHFSFPVGKKGNYLQIPQIIKKDEKLIRLFIKGLFDTDGCIFFDKRPVYKKPYPRIVLEISSHKLFKEVSDYLKNHFRIFTHKRLRERKFTIYSLEIYGHRNFEKWMKLIGFSNEKHLKKCSLSSVW